MPPITAPSLGSVTRGEPCHSPLLHGEGRLSRDPQPLVLDLGAVQAANNVLSMGYESRGLLSAAQIPRSRAPHPLTRSSPGRGGESRDGANLRPSPGTRFLPGCFLLRHTSRRAVYGVWAVSILRPLEGNLAGNHFSFAYHPRVRLLPWRFVQTRHPPYTELYAQQQRQSSNNKRHALTQPKRFTLHSFPTFTLRPLLQAYGYFPSRISGTAAAVAASYQDPRHAPEATRVPWLRYFFPQVWEAPIWGGTCMHADIDFCPLGRMPQ